MIVNYLNPKGISLVREKIEIKWAPDSLFNNISNNADSLRVDTSAATIIKLEDQVKESTEHPKETTKTNKIPVSEIKEETPDEIREVIAFPEPQAITLEQAYKLFTNGVKFVDSRDEADFLAGHITNSINIPFDYVEDHKHKLEQLSKDNPLIVYCGGTDCDLSHLLANLLFEQGYKQVYVFFGGWNEWLEANYPVDKSSE